MPLLVSPHAFEERLNTLNPKTYRPGTPGSYYVCTSRYLARQRGQSLDTIGNALGGDHSLLQTLNLIDIAFVYTEN